VSNGNGSALAFKSGKIKDRAMELDDWFSLWACGMAEVIEDIAIWPQA
jgi:hypothetical protein